ncbi:MAG: serine hydrolase domain-containing protein [Rubricoccaceae bacterium]|nr:serine hydrolase domain-containing protein [Rubricoccaceae bacterium]
MTRLLVLAVLLVASAAAQPADTLGARADALVAPYVALGMFDGVVLLARGDTVLVNAGYGMASHEHAVPNTPDTRFRIASVSKPFTALAIGTLYGGGRLTPETTLDRFAPAVPQADEITIAHLLAHRSGVVHINDLDWYDDAMQGDLPLDTLVARIAAEPLDFDPGTDYLYSNGGYALLAHVIERVSGMAYGDHLDRHVLGPLGLADTAHERFGALVPRLARGYQPGPAPGSRVPATTVAPAIKIGGGSLTSTAADLHRFADALFEDNVVPAAVYDALFGAGPVLYFSGRAPGYNAVVMHNRTADATVVVLSNSYAVTANSLAPALMGLLLGTAPSLPRYAVDGAPGADRLARAAGRYRWPAPFETRFELRPTSTGWVYDEVEQAEGRPSAALPLADGGLLLTMYDTRCTLTAEAAVLDCTAPWTGTPLRIARDGEAP